MEKLATGQKSEGNSDGTDDGWSMMKQIVIKSLMDHNSRSEYSFII